MNKTVLITGSSSGIGRDTAIAYAKKNYNIVLNCKSSIDNMLCLKQEIETYNKNVLAIQCDISNYDEVKKMFIEIKNTFGYVDILINNAGISHFGLFSDMTQFEWNKVIDTNIKGVVNCSHLAIHNMVKNKCGTIINITSIWGVCGASCEVIYSMTKAGIDGFTKALAKELGPSNIFVNSIACGLIETKMNNNLNEEDKQNFIDEIPLSKIGTGNDVAALCLYLSEKNDYMTGQVLVLDGGYL